MDKPRQTVSKRLLISLAVVVLVGCVSLGIALQAGRSSAADFKPPDKARRARAVGSLAPIASATRGYYRESESFDPLPTPGEADWLNGPGKADRGGQNFGQFLRASRNPVTEKRKTLYIRPLGDFKSEQQELLGILKQFAQAYFQMPVKILPQMDPREMGITRRINQNTKKPQLLTGDILKSMKTAVPSDAYCVISLTLTDLYPQASWNYVFGQASLRDRVGVFSLARYKPSFFRASGQEQEGDSAKLTIRACKVLSHELGHMFGVRHCVFYHCNMNGSNHLAETDAAPLHVCPVCLRKLQTAIGFDPTKRYQQLATFFEEQSLEEEASWTRTRLQLVSPN